MKTDDYFRHATGCIAAIISFCFILASPLLSQKKPKSILDYYLALPDEYFICELSPKITMEFKEKQIVRKNIKSGYIQAKSENYPMEVALFTDDHLKLSFVAVNVKCGAGCMCNKFAILSLSDGGKWSDLTSGVFPTDKQIGNALKEKDVIYEYVLPEIGTVIKVVNANTKKVLLNICWSGGMFMIK